MLPLHHGRWHLTDTWTWINTNIITMRSKWWPYLTKLFNINMVIDLPETRIMLCEKYPESGSKTWILLDFKSDIHFFSQLDCWYLVHEHNQLLWHKNTRIIMKEKTVYTLIDEIYWKITLFGSHFEFLKRNIGTDISIFL